MSAAKELVDLVEKKKRVVVRKHAKTWYDFGTYARKNIASCKDVTFSHPLIHPYFNKKKGEYIALENPPSACKAAYTKYMAWGAANPDKTRKIRKKKKVVAVEEKKIENTGSAEKVLESASKIASQNSSGVKVPISKKTVVKIAKAVNKKVKDAKAHPTKEKIHTARSALKAIFSIFSNIGHLMGPGKPRTRKTKSNQSSGSKSNQSSGSKSNRTSASKSNRNSGSKAFNNSSPHHALSNIIKSVSPFIM